MLKSGSDMMAAAESEVHSLEEFEALKMFSLVKSIPQKSPRAKNCSPILNLGC